MNNQLGFDEMMNAALGFQRQLWDTWAWAGSVGAKAPSNPWDQGMERSLRMSEELVNHCFKLQADCVKAMMKCLEPGEAAPEAFGQYFSQLQEALDELLNAQRSGFEIWFKLMRPWTPFPPSGNVFGKGAGELFETWQKISEEAAQRQARFFFSLFPVQQEGQRDTRREGANKTQAPRTKPHAA